MADEHVHAWDAYVDWEDRIRFRCDCGADLPWYDAVSALEQQLADERAEKARMDSAITRVNERMGELRTENATMRALLYLFSADEAEPVIFQTDNDEEGWFCMRCDTWIAEYEPDHFPHAPECPWLRARALLADKEPEP